MQTNTHRRISTRERSSISMVAVVGAATVLLCVISSAVSADTVEIDGLLLRQPSGTRARGPERRVGIDVGSTAVQTLSRASGAIVIRDLPLADGSSETFAAHRFEAFTENALIFETDGTIERRLPLPAITLFRGAGIDNPDRHLMLAVVDQVDVWAMVMDGDSVTTLIGPAAAPERPRPHELFESDAFALLPDRTLCAGGVPPGGPLPAGATSETARQAGQRAVSDEELVVELLIDVGYLLYSGSFGGSSATASGYVGLLVGAVSSIYQRDMRIIAKVDTLVLWTSPEPFDGADSEQQLARYGSYNWQQRAGTPRDLAHYLNYHPSYGGIAYLNGLCSSLLGNAVSNIYGDFTFPVVGFAWDVMVVAHEMGHNFGSPHTHCYSPPIDKCWGGEVGCYNGPSVPQVGEIMSYCHLVDTIQLGFAGRVGDLIRSEAEGSACLHLKVSTCGDGIVDADEQCDDGNADDTDCCTSTCQLQSAGPGPCEDGQFCTLDYACPNGDCYQMMRDCDDTNLCTVDFCDEETNSCEHHSRDGVQCDDGAFCTTLDTCNNGSCGGQPRDCADDSACTADSCDESTTQCLHANLPPATGCRTAGVSQLKIKAAGDRSRLVWRWTKGDATDTSAFGVPQYATDYSLCVYDQSEQLMTSMRAPAGGFCAGRPCWRALPNGTHKYADRTATSDGLVAAILKPGTQNRARVVMRGKGGDLALPALPIGTGSLTVQLRKGDDTVCWESQFSEPFIRDDGTQFSDTQRIP